MNAGAGQASSIAYMSRLVDLYRYHRDVGWWICTGTTGPYSLNRSKFWPLKSGRSSNNTVYLRGVLVIDSTDDIPDLLIWFYMG